MTGTARARSLGPTCSAVASGAGRAPRCSPSATAHWGSGKRCATCSRPARRGRLRRWGSPPARPWRPCAPTSGARRGLAALVPPAPLGVRRGYGAKWPKAVAKITNDLDVPAHHQPDRVDLRKRPGTAAGHQGTRLAGRRDRDDVQTHRVGTAPLACRQFRPSRRAGQSRRQVRERRRCRTTRRFNKR